MLDCRACGACCATSADWPRFTLEDDAAIERIPAALRDDARGAMRCDGDRCAGLAGAVGRDVSCLVYADRPDVCRACEPGDDACAIARRHHRL
jgi:Fe-S-cluster containining protein